MKITGISYVLYEPLPRHIPVHPNAIRTTVTTLCWAQIFFPRLSHANHSVLIEVLKPVVISRMLWN